MTIHERYMYRCIELAKKGSGFVAPNPMVGAVLVYENNIIGEGHHKKYGEAHAEVNCLQSVKNEYKTLIDNSALYVSLEPCAHYGKTPPCADLIIYEKIKKVYVGCSDSFVKVNGKGIEKLRNAGVAVTVDILKDECLDVNKRFFTFYTKQRPYITLKWAQTADGKIAGNSDERLFISNELSNRLVHKWRTEEAAILVGTNTVIKDDPLLSARLWPGKNPVRLVIDKGLKMATTYKIFNNEASTIIFNEQKDDEAGNVILKRIDFNNPAGEIADYCFAAGIQSILIEGGAKTLQSFINAGLWDEARVITNTLLLIGEGVDAPVLKGTISETQTLLNDRIDIIYNR